MTDEHVDPSVEPLLQLWRNAEKNQRVPDSKQLQAALAKRLWKQVRWEEGKIVLPAGLQLNVSAFAKGWIVDQVAAHIKQQGVQALINFAESSYAAVGMDAEILVRAIEGGAAQAIQIKAGQCLASSGSDRSAVIIGEQRFSHFADPHTGLLLQSARYATVVADSAIKADALATMACIVSHEKAITAFKSNAVDAAIHVLNETHSAYGAWPVTKQASPKK